MYLISAHIENFGKLHDLDLRFSRSLHVIVQPNGWGKSTLASFLCAMFYGLGDSRRKGPDLRGLYAPWQGGAFGGSLVFRAGDRTYRVLRTFGAKSREDTFFLYDAVTGLPSGDYTEALGRELFGIDAASFARSVYMPQLLSGGTSDRSAASAGKGAGSGTALPPATLAPAAPDIRAKITDLGGEDADLRRCDAACGKLRKEADALSPDRRTGAIRRGQETLERLQADALRIPALEASSRSLAERYEDLRRQRRTVEQEQESLRQRSADLGRAMEASRILRERTLAENETALAEEELSRIQAQRAALQTRLQVLAEQQRAENASPETQALRANLADLQAQIRAAEASQLRIARRGSLLQQQVRADRQHLRQSREALDTPVFRIAAAPASVPAAAALALLFLVVMAALSAGGYGILPAAACLICAGLAAACALYLRSLRIKRSAAEEAYDAESGRLAQEQADLHELVLRSKALRGRLRRMGSEARAVSARLRKNSSGDPGSRDAELEALMAQQKDLSMAESAARTRLQAAAGDPLRGDGPSAVPDEEALRETAALAENEPLSLTELSEELLALQREAEVLQQEEDRCRGQLREADEELAQCRESAAAAEDLRGQIAEMEDRYRLLQTAQACLRDAASAYSRGYMLPFLDSFESYYDRLAGDPLLFHSDTGLGITAEAEGLPRAFTSFSTGSRDLLEICRHLALCDSMFRGERPFLILDDPFVNLDDARLRAALAMLRTLAEDRQILYLTCHESRVP